MGVAVQNEDYNTRFQDVGGTVVFGAADVDTTLVTVPNASYSIFIQKLIVEVITNAAQSASFEDSNTTPRIVGALVASPGVGFQTFDYGRQGFQLTEGKNFLINVSAAGLGMNVKWEGYMRPTAASRTAADL